MRNSLHEAGISSAGLRTVYSFRAADCHESKMASVFQGVWRLLSRRGKAPRISWILHKDCCKIREIRGWFDRPLIPGEQNFSTGSLVRNSQFFLERGHCYFRLVVANGNCGQEAAAVVLIELQIAMRRARAGLRPGEHHEYP